MILIIMTLLVPPLSPYLSRHCTTGDHALQGGLNPARLGLQSHGRSHDGPCAQGLGAQQHLNSVVTFITGGLEKTTFCSTSRYGGSTICKVFRCLAFLKSIGGFGQIWQKLTVLHLTRL
jgi:hypothetical protein